MPSPRLFRRATTVATLVGLLVLAASLAPGHADNKDKKDKKDKKGKFGDSTVKIDLSLNDYDTNTCPYELKVNYTTDEDGLEVYVDYAGKCITSNPQDAPKPDGTLTFPLDFVGDTTGTNVTVYLRSKADPSSVRATDMRYGLTFLTGGMFESFKFEIPKGSKLAEKAKKAGDPIGAGIHHGQFPSPYPHVLLGAHARMWIQGKFKPIPSGCPGHPIQPPLKTDYDRPVGLHWQVRNGKWYPCWSVLLTEDLKALPVRPGGEEPLTIVRVLLLDHKDKVLQIITYNQ